MLLLMKIGEDVKREARIEEQRRRSREESDRKVGWALKPLIGTVWAEVFASFDIWVYTLWDNNGPVTPNGMHYTKLKVMKFTIFWLYYILTIIQKVLSNYLLQLLLTLSQDINYTCNSSRKKMTNWFFLTQNFLEKVLSISLTADFLDQLFFILNDT